MTNLQWPGIKLEVGEVCIPWRGSFEKTVEEGRYVCHNHRLRSQHVSRLLLKYDPLNQTGIPFKGRKASTPLIKLRHKKGSFLSITLDIPRSIE